MKVLHVDIDAFFASVEQVRNPRLRGRPVIVGSGVIASCSYEARAFGLRAGMPLHTAKRICPVAVILPGHQPTYRCFAQRVFDRVAEVSVGMETYLDEAVADLAGTERAQGSAIEVGRRLKRAVLEDTGLRVTVGIGPNRMLAKLAGKSVKPDGLFQVREEDAEAFLEGRPVGDLPGVGPKTRELFQKLGLDTVGSLRALTLGQLTGLLGKNGATIYERARGRDTRPVSRDEIPRSISRETTFHRETSDPNEIAGMLYYLCERAAATARGLGVLAGSVSVKVRYEDFDQAEVAARLPEPTNLDSEIFDAAVELLPRAKTRRVNVRLIGVTLTRFRPEGDVAPSLFSEERVPRERREALCRALDAIRARYGFSAIVGGRSLELLGKLQQDSYGYVLRTPSLTK